MTKKRTARTGPRRRGQKKPVDSEWMGGIFSMPNYVTGEGEPYRPETLFWMDAEEVIIGYKVAKPGKLLSMASESLQSTIERPMFGRPHAPTRVRVASTELSDVLRAGHPELDIVCAPTPELDEVFYMMYDRMDEGGEQSYLSPDIGPDVMASFFQAASGLFRAGPWKVVPSDQSLFSVTIEKLGVLGAAMSVIGQIGQVKGLILFSSLDDFETYLDSAYAIQHGEEPEIPPYFALHFERRAELAPELRKEIAEHNWEVAGQNAYPQLVAVDEEMVARPPTSAEVAMFEAIARALTEVLTEKKVLRAAWKGGEPLSRTLTVETHQGELDVTLCAPCMREPAAFDISHDISHDVLADLAAFAGEHGEADSKVRSSLEDELVHRFATSPEAKDLDEIQACRFVMEFASDYFGKTIATLNSSELSEIIFDIIPRKVGIDESEARWIIEESRAFYMFLRREYKLKQADSCLEVLGGAAIKKLKEALSDSSNFGLAKSLLPLSASQPSFYSFYSERPPASTASKKAAKAKKNKRKAVRKARKRNR